MTSRPGAPARMPPVVPLAVATMVLVVLGGIYLAAHLPTAAPLGPAVGLLAGAGVLLAATLLALARAPLAWRTFFLVGRYALLAYAIIAGMLEYVFVLDHTRGAPLVVLTVMLAVYAVDIPLLLAFSVARHQAR